MSFIIPEISISFCDYDENILACQFIQFFFEFLLSLQIKYLALYVIQSN